MKFNRKYVILFVIIVIIGVVLSRRQDNYTFTRDEVRKSLLNHIETNVEPDMVYMSQMMDKIQIDDNLKKDIYMEGDKGDLADKTKLTELIKKI